MFDKTVQTPNAIPDVNQATNNMSDMTENIADDCRHDYMDQQFFNSDLNSDPNFAGLENQNLKLMIDVEVEAQIEALLFVAGEPISLDILADILDIKPTKLLEILEVLAVRWAGDKHKGLYIRSINNNFFITPKPKYKKILTKLYEPKNQPALTIASYEALAIIAYNQPVTRAQVEAVRGVNSDGLIQRLLERELIEIKGQLDAPGRPSLFGTTDKFLLEFGLNSIDSLPPMELLMYSSLQTLENSLLEASGSEAIKKQISIDQLLEG